MNKAALAIYALNIVPLFFNQHISASSSLASESDTSPSIRATLSDANPSIRATLSEELSGILRDIPSTSSNDFRERRQSFSSMTSRILREESEDRPYNLSILPSTTRDFRQRLIPAAVRIVTQSVDSKESDGLISATTSTAHHLELPLRDFLRSHAITHALSSIPLITGQDFERHGEDYTTVRSQMLSTTSISAANGNTYANLIPPHQDLSSTTIKAIKETGKREGIHKTRLEVVSRMLDNGFNSSDIFLLTSIPIYEIESIRDGKIS